MNHNTRRKGPTLPDQGRCSLPALLLTRSQRNLFPLQKRRRPRNASHSSSTSRNISKRTIRCARKRRERLSLDYMTRREFRLSVSVWEGRASRSTCRVCLVPTRMSSDSHMAANDRNDQSSPRQLTMPQTLHRCRYHFQHIPRRPQPLPPNALLPFCPPTVIQAQHPT